MTTGLSELSRVFAGRREATALCAGDETLTYAQYYACAAALAGQLQQAGVGSRMTVAVELENSIDFAIAYLAGAVGGYRLVPVNPALPESQKQYLYTNTAPDMILRAPLGQEVRNALVRPVENFHFNPAAELVFFTSGTTSRPKGVRHSLERMAANAAAFNRLTGCDDTLVMMNLMPMSYMAGFLNTLLAPLMAGGTVVITPGFSADLARNVWTLAMRHAINAIWLSPTMAAMLTRLNRSQEIPAWTAAHLERVFVGTAPLPRAVRDAFETTFGVRCFESYGMTEVLLVSCQVDRGDCHDGSVGQLLEGVTVQARSEQGEALEQGAEGELWLHSPYLLLEYRVGEDGEPQQPFIDGWLPTGDLGRRDEQGRLYITGRLKDLIIHGGVNVSPRAVEDQLLIHPQVRAVAVIGAPHAFWGEEVVAFVVPEDASACDRDVLKAHCQERLVPDAVPGRIEIISSLPCTVTGKVRKELLRELL